MLSVNRIYNKRENRFPIYKDKYQDAGRIAEHYFLQDIYFSKIICQTRSKVHYDIGSRVEGGISHLLGSSCIEKVIMLDIRPLPIEVERLEFIQADATELNEVDDRSLMSISSLHAIEHFGLGRYGDSIDPFAWKKVLKAIQKKLAVGGLFGNSSWERRKGVL